MYIITIERLSLVLPPSQANRLDMVLDSLARQQHRTTKRSGPSTTVSLATPTMDSSQVQDNNQVPRGLVENNRYEGSSQ